MNRFATDVEAAETAEAGVEDERVEYLQDGIGPNFRVAIAPNGYIWASVNVDLLSTQFYCDAQVARAMARMLTNAADEHDKIVKELESRELLSQASNVIDLGAVRDAQFEVVDEIEALSAQHDDEVEEALVAADQKFD